MLQWFRKKVRDSEAPKEAASAAPKIHVPERREPSQAEETDPKRPRRRRGARGGRGRKKATDKPAVEAAKPDEKEKPKRAPRKRSQPKRAERPELPPVKKEILVSVEVGEQRVAVLEDGKPAEVYLERPGKRSIAGNVYKGTVDNVLPGMEASFVDIGLDRNGFLYVDEIIVPELEGKPKTRRIQELIERGQEVLVQAVKDPMGTKGARLTTEVSLPGRFLVFVPSGEGVGISRRLEEAERERLKAISKELELPEGGIIIRTAAEGASKEELQGDLALLRKLWSTIQGRAGRSEAPSLVYQEAELPLRIVRDLFIRDFERVVVDHERTHRRIIGYLRRTSKDLAERVELYTGKQPLMDKAGVDEAIRSTLNPRVNLPSGGYLIFDYAEAFTAIDVNTGRFVGARGKGSASRLEDTITKNNLEAVEEVVRQLRLRDIGGIIVIDFIDMANPKNRAAVEDALRRELDRDRTKTYVVEISPLGLVEMTRQNVTDGPREILTVECPTCEGEGVIVSDETHAVEAERKLRRLVTTSRHQAYSIEMNSRVAGILIGPGASRLNELEQETGRRFFFETRDDLPSGHFEVVAKGPTARLEGKSLPVSAGEQMELKLEEKHLHDDTDAIARLNGYVVTVAGAGNRIGQTVKVRIERATRTVAYAVLAEDVETEAPVEAGVELEQEVEGIVAEPSTPAKSSTTRKSSTAGKPSTTEKAGTRDKAITDEKPKKRTRRGSRGGRGRKKKTAAPAAAEAAGAGLVPPVEEQELQSDAKPSEPADGKPSESAADEPEKPKKKTRRGSRGGRNRRRKPAAPTTAVGSVDGKVPDEALGEPETVPAPPASQDGKVPDEPLELAEAGESPLVTSESEQ